MLAAVSFIFTLSNVQYTGEEAVYPLMSYEMWYHGHILTPIMYGQDYWRPPLYNLLITGLSMLIGWSHMLVAARLIAGLATVGSGLLVGWFTRRIWKDKELAAFAALVYITLGNILFYYGWLAYSDPLFAFFCLAAMLFGWLAVAERRIDFFVIAIFTLSCAFLTKALTAYVFYGATVFVVTYRTSSWRFLLSWRSWLVHLLALVVPVLWYAIAPAGGAMANGMLYDIIEKMQGRGILGYLHHFLVYPIQTFWQFFPVGGVILYAVLRRYPMFKMNDPQMGTALWVAGVNFLPYWLSPQGGNRYLLPLYGIIAVVLARLLINSGKVRYWAVKWMLIAIILKYIFALWLFPLYTELYRPHLMEIAKNVLQNTRDEPLYVTNVAWVGIGVTADIDLAIRPHPPLVTPPINFSNGFVISYPGNVPKGDIVVSKYQGAWLLCRGIVCGQRSLKNEPKNINKIE